MRVSESALILADAVAGVEVQTEKVFKFSEEFSLPTAFVVNTLDRENASFERAVASLQGNFGRCNRSSCQLALKKALRHHRLRVEGL
jgi:elongation factor G